MQKLSGNNIDKFYRSCRVFSLGVQQNWVRNFLIFLSFPRDFPSSSKTPSTIGDSFYSKVPRTFDSLQKYPWFTEKLLERNEGLQLGPWTNGGGGLAGIRRFRRHSWPDEGWSSSRCSPRACLRPELGRRGTRRRCSATPSGASRGGDCSGEVEARLRLRAVGKVQ
jgi:hypothetical protein